MHNGCVKYIKNISFGDIVKTGGKVVGIVKSKSNIMYNVDGIIVSGDHPIYHNNKWMRVMDGGFESIDKEYTVYNLITENHRIVARSLSREIMFTDYDEIDDTKQKEIINIEILNSEL